MEIHVLADHTRTPKQIVRDIESATLIKIGAALDHKQISVAQLGEKEQATFVSCPRFQFERIGSSTGEGELQIELAISSDEEVFVATATGPNTRQYRLRLVAEATLHAVEKYLNSSNKFVAADVQKVRMGEQEIIVVLVSLCFGSREEIIPGSALNKGDEMEATVRATLDTINRRLFAIERV
ncbi:MAG: hypothetical protein GX883_03540 [Firmicutes bacterium]|nr:hypothetical protein [Bacillota bacterium]